MHSLPQFIESGLRNHFIDSLLLPILSRYVRPLTLLAATGQSSLTDLISNANVKSETSISHKL